MALFEDEDGQVFLCEAMPRSPLFMSVPEKGEIIHGK
jgi:hypothetical protein